MHKDQMTEYINEKYQKYDGIKDDSLKAIKELSNGIVIYYAGLDGDIIKVVFDDEGDSRWYVIDERYGKLYIGYTRMTATGNTPCVEFAFGDGSEPT